ncbi:MAG: 50S ribosomal protein L11 methyltransferase, partial [Fusobacteria bacterium]|nr:50S ribosomal protein L11 methyltransferase [Fusobacteriota bacterium]
GCSLVVRPIWEEYTPKYGEKLIVIDPKMAFGTGTHATTAHCLRFVEKYVKVGDRVLDIGTGSSILLVASKLFGASKLIGVDIDEEALLSAEENLKLNGISDYELSTSFSDSRSYDVVIANIICEVLIDLFNSMVNKMQKNGLLFLSGILIEKTGKMEAIILHSKLEIVEKSIEDGWVGYVCKKSY